MQIETLISETSAQVDRAMADYCSRYLAGPSKLIEAMRYSLEAGGKRIRPVLVVLSSRLYGGDLQESLVPAAAIEMIHTFSLIHDDLPAMDNDDFRRGRATSHKVYGEAMAILAGDALLAFAFELISKHYPGPTDRVVRLIAELAEATGPGGMTGGQVLDMTFSEAPQTLEEVQEVHRLKTAALIRCACRLGAISADATDLDPISEYGLKLGLAFQVMDDYLDQTGTTAEVGKRTGKDADGGKPNYAILSGDISSAWQRAQELVDQARQALEPFGESAEPLRELATLVLTRKS